MGDSPAEKINIKEFLSLVEGLQIVDFERQSPPEPDFYVETNVGIIGTEHTNTRLTLKNENVDHVADYIAAIDNLNKSGEVLKSLTKEKIHLKVSFHSPPKGSGLANTQKVHFAEELTTFVIKNLPKEGQRIAFDNFHGK